MALAPGTRLGVYEILTPIGVGGMGEVYRARDTRLKRDVALKVLPDTFAQDPDRLARFQREAELLATLNHPNIAGIYGLEESNGVRALVLELVEGPTLADRIAKGPIPLDEALPIARQIAEALEAAHEKGVIHRDLKPSNVKITPDGTVKVLDFGLAKLADAPAASGAAVGLSQSPTITTPAMMTGVGTILGTAAYMSPEQAKGRPADKRSDVWAFGCVLYEMLTGKRAFEGEDVTDTLAAVLRGEPHWAALGGGVPVAVRTLLQWCLEKDRRKRVGDVSTILFLLQHYESLTSSAGEVTRQSIRPRHAIVAVAASLFIGALGVITGLTIRVPASAPASVTRFAIALPEGQNFSNAGRQVLAVSPDGTQVMYVANQRLHLRAMSGLDPRPIPGIDGSYGVVNPVFSPDGRSIVFWSGGDQTLKRIAVTGGAPITIAAVANPVGMSWGSDGIVLGGGAKGVLRVSPNGGTPEVVVSTKGDEVAHGPQMLPGGTAVLFTLAQASSELDRWDKAKIVVQSLASGERKILIDGGSDARYVPSGHLLYALSGVVLAVPFDLRSLQVSGGPVPIVEGVRRAGGTATGTAQFSVAANGSLAYVPGPVSTSAGDRELALIDRKGAATPLKVPPGAIEHPRMSPDGRRVAFVTDDNKGTIVWTYELSGATAMHRVTFNGRNRFPIWTADGKRVVFQSDREGDLGIFWAPADGSGNLQRLTTADKDTEHIPESWSPKDDGFLFRVTKGGVSTLSFFSLRDKRAVPFGAVQSAGPTNAMFSPDGRWVAYESRSAGGPAGFGELNSGPNAVVYVQPFPATGATYQVPTVEQGGYRHPSWSPDGKELFFMIGGNVRFRVASVKTQPEFAFTNAEPVTRPAYWLDNAADNARQWDVLPDGQHFIIRTPAGSAGQPATVGQGQQIQVVLNWFEELKQRVPTK